MPVLRAIARPMLGSIYVVQGFDTMMHPEQVVAAAEPVVRPIADRVSVVPDQAEQVVRISGGVQFVAGLLLTVGKLPRLSALAIAATLIPTTLAGHRFWEAEDDKERAQQRIHFLKNVSMLGGLLIAGADTAGQPSLAWRGRYAIRTARRDAARATAAQARVKAAKAGAKTAKAGAKAAKTRAKVTGQARAKAAKTSARASRLGNRLPVNR
jgi:putative oxidoreductase